MGAFFKGAFSNVLRGVGGAVVLVMVRARRPAAAAALPALLQEAGCCPVRASLD